MSDWATITWDLKLNDRHTETDVQRLILHIQGWADEDGYAEDIHYEAEQRLVWCEYTGECGFNAESDVCAFLTALARQEETDIRLEWESDDTEESCSYFGPNAGSRRIRDALRAIDDPIQTIRTNQDALTVDLCQSIAHTSQRLLQLIEAANNTRSPRLSIPVDQDITAAISAVNILNYHLLIQIKETQDSLEEDIS